MMSRPHVAVFDLDGTLTRYDTYLRYLLGYLCAHPDRIPRAWHLPVDACLFKTGLRDNTWLKKRFLGAILGGLTQHDLSAWTRRFVDQVMKSGLRRGAVEALRRHQSRRDRTILLSASPDIFVQEIAGRLQFSECACTITERDEHGRLTGDLQDGNCYGAEKLRRMERLIGQHRGDVHVVAYGDDVSDFALLSWADEGIAVNPSRGLAALATRSRLPIVQW
jgi:phosphatidylglycerophosphatase C